jgi:hypothetical protein
MKKKITKKQTEHFAPLTLFPKINSAKLSREGNMGIAPLIDLGKGCFGVESNWRLVGWSEAPYRGSAPQALVVEKLEHGNSFGDMWRHCELGVLYWVHANAYSMKFKLTKSPKTW